MISLTSFTDLEIPKKPSGKEDPKTTYAGGLFPYTEDPYRLYGLHNDAPVDVSIEQDLIPLDITKPTLLQNEIALARSDQQPSYDSYPSVTHFIYSRMIKNICEFEPQTGGRTTNDPKLDSRQRPANINIYSSNYENEAIQFRNRMIGLLAGVKNPKGKGRKFPDGTRFHLEKLLFDAYYTKSNYDSKFRNLLLQTGNDELVYILEKDYFLPGDATFLGVGERGQESRELDRGNALGRALMKVRARIRSEEPAVTINMEARLFYPYYKIYTETVNAVKDGFFPKYIGSNLFPATFADHTENEREIAKIWSSYSSYPEELKRFYRKDDLSWIARLYSEYINRRTVYAEFLATTGKDVHDIAKALGNGVLKKMYIDEKRNSDERKEVIPPLDQWIENKGLNPVVLGASLAKTISENAWDKYVNSALQTEYKNSGSQQPYEEWKENQMRHPIAFLRRVGKYDPLNIVIRITPHLSSEPLRSEDNYDPTLQVSFYRPSQNVSTEEYFSGWDTDVREPDLDLYVLPEGGLPEVSDKNEKGDDAGGDEAGVEAGDAEDSDLSDPLGEGPPLVVNPRDSVLDVGPHESEEAEERKKSEEEEEKQIVIETDVVEEEDVPAGDYSEDEEEYVEIKSSDVPVDTGGLLRPGDVAAISPAVVPPVLPPPQITARPVREPKPPVVPTEEDVDFLAKVFERDLKYRREAKLPEYTLPTREIMSSLLDVPDKLRTVRNARRRFARFGLAEREQELAEMMTEPEEFSFKILVDQSILKKFDEEASELVDYLFLKLPKSSLTHLPKYGSVKLVNEYENFIWRRQKEAPPMYAESADDRPPYLRLYLPSSVASKKIAPFSEAESEAARMYSEEKSVFKGEFREGTYLGSDPRIVQQKATRKAQISYQNELFYRSELSKYKYIIGQGDPVSLPAREGTVYIDIYNYRGRVWSYTGNAWVPNIVNQIYPLDVLAFITDESPEVEHEFEKAVTEAMAKKAEYITIEKKVVTSGTDLGSDREIKLINHVVLFYYNLKTDALSMPVRARDGSWSLKLLSPYWDKPQEPLYPIYAVNDSRIGVRLANGPKDVPKYKFPPPSTAPTPFVTWSQSSRPSKTVYFGDDDDPVYKYLNMDYEAGFEGYLPRNGKIWYPTVAHFIIERLSLPVMYRTYSERQFLYEAGGEEMNFGPSRKWKSIKSLISGLVKFRREKSIELFEFLCKQGISLKLQNPYYKRLLASTKYYNTPVIVADELDGIKEGLELINGPNVSEDEVVVHLDDVWYEFGTLNANRKEAEVLDKRFTATLADYVKEGEDFTKMELKTEIQTRAYLKVAARLRQLDKDLSLITIRRQVIMNLLSILSIKEQMNVQVNDRIATQELERLLALKQAMLKSDSTEEIEKTLTAQEKKLNPVEKAKKIASRKDLIQRHNHYYAELGELNRERLMAVLAENTANRKAAVDTYLGTQGIDEIFEEISNSLPGGEMPVEMNSLYDSIIQIVTHLHDLRVALDVISSRLEFLKRLISSQELKIQKLLAYREYYESLTDVRRGSIVYVSLETPERNTIITETFTKLRDELTGFQPFFVYEGSGKRMARSAIEQAREYDYVQRKYVTIQGETLRPPIRLKTSGILWKTLNDRVVDLVNAVFAFGLYTFQGRTALAPQKAMVVSSDKIAFVIYTIFRVKPLVNKPVEPRDVIDLVYAAYSARRTEIQSIMYAENKERIEYARYIAEQEGQASGKPTVLENAVQLAAVGGLQTRAGYDVEQGQLSLVMKGTVPDIQTVYMNTEYLQDAVWDDIVYFLEEVTTQSVDMTEPELTKVIRRATAKLSNTVIGDMVKVSLHEAAAREPDEKMRLEIEEEIKSVNNREVACRGAVINVLSLIYTYYKDSVEITQSRYEPQDISTVAVIILSPAARLKWNQRKRNVVNNTGLDKIREPVARIYGQYQSEEALLDINSLIQFCIKLDLKDLDNNQFELVRHLSRMTFFALPY
jgi:hypothetical protein